MGEKLSQGVEQLNNNPLEILKSLSQEKKILQQEIMKNQGMIDTFVQYIENNRPDDMKKIPEGVSLRDYLSSQIMGFSPEKILIDGIDKFIPGIRDAKQMLDGISSLFGGDDSKSLVDEYISLWKSKPLDIKKIEDWMLTHDISLHKYENPGEGTLPVITEPSTISSPVDEVSSVNVEQLQLDKVIELAKSQVGITEKDNGADKYFSELGYKYNSKKVPWCGAFVSRILKESDIPLPKNDLSAKSFIGEAGLGHVGIKVDGKIISGNYGDKVSFSHIDKPIIGYAIPKSSGLEIHKEQINFDQIPEGAIVVYNRNSARKAAA